MNKRAPGFTLVEMLVVTLIGSIVMGSIYKMITIQDNTTRQQYAIVQNNQNARMALAVLTSELKEMSSRDGDVTYADSTILEFRALRKAGIVCDKDPGNAWIDVWVFGDSFVSGVDSVLVYQDGANANSMIDDNWRATQVSSASAETCPPSEGFTGVAVQRLNLSSGLANVHIGGLIRSFVRTRYALADAGNGWGVINRTEAGGAPVAIIDGLATVSEGGLHMRFIDSTSAVIPYANLRAAGTRLDEIMRVQVKVRGKSVAPVTRTSNRFTDSLVTEIYVRGNARGR